jgi:hypothetical protein
VAVVLVASVLLAALLLATVRLICQTGNGFH